MQGTPEKGSTETILAFDFGLRRIGVAAGQSVTRSASPLGAVGNSDRGVDHQAIRKLVDEWRPDRLVVGLPLEADGTAGDMARAARSFARDLARYGLPVETVDERHTSIEAADKLKRARVAGARGRISKAAIDGGAAALIAERYLARRE